MKIIQNYFFMFIVILILITLSCNDDDNGISPYAGLTLIISDEQVYTRNSQAVKVSEAYVRFNGNYLVYADIVPSDEELFKIGHGEIINGRLSFTVPALNEDKLMEWDSFINYFSRYWKNVSIDKTATKGSMMLVASYNGSEWNGMLDRQRLKGTSTSMTQDTLLYFFVDRDCVIRGDHNSGVVDHQYVYETEGNLFLSLKRGWNIVYRTETYFTNQNGIAKIGMEIRNPIKSINEFKWVLYQDYKLY